MKKAFLQIYHLLQEGDLLKIAVLFIMMIIASVLTLIGVGMVPVFVSAVIDADRILNYPVLGEFLTGIDITTPQELALFGAFALIVIYLLKNLFMVFYNYMNNKFMLNRMLFLKNRIFRAYMNSPYTFFIRRNSSELLRNINDEVGNIINGTLKPALLISLNSITTLVVVVGLIYVEPLITGVGILFFGGFTFLFLRLTEKAISRYGSESLIHRKSMTKAILEGLQGFKDAKVLKRENYFLQEYNDHAYQHKEYDLKNSVLNSLPRQIIEMIALSGILFIAVILVLQGREVSSIVPMIALFGAAVIKLKPSINSIIADVNRIRYNIYSVDTVYRDLVYLEDNYDQNTPDRIGDKLQVNSEIRLENLNYSYPDESHDAIKNINISIPKNAIVAFVGPSGVGKTTLVDLILGLLIPQEGTITIDGEDLFSNLDSWQRNIGYIPQSINLLDDTIRRNICFGIPADEIDEDMLETAIEIAQLKEFIATLKDGLETIVGERGVRLSGGQQQRIGIARALYTNPQVLIMDEATSALDNITERVFIESIDRLRGDKTIIMIAHRLTTVKNCDTIYMMNDGEVIAEGDYESLLVNSKEFREMSLIDED